MTRVAQFILLIGWTVSAIPFEIAHADYQVVFRDGAVAVTGRLGNIDDPTRDVRVEGRSLFAVSADVRAIRSQHVSVTHLGPFIELANGDILRGRIRGFQPGTSSSHKLIVELKDSSFVSDSVQLKIWPRFIVRVSTSQSSLRDQFPGTLKLADGRRVVAKSVRWTTDGIAALTGDGVLLADFDQIVDLTIPRVDRNACLLADARLAHAIDDSSSALIVSASTTHGSRITFPRAMCATKKLAEIAAEGRRQIETVRSVLAIRPSWSQTTLLVDPLMIACRTYRRATEFPLSAFLARSVQQRTAIQNLGWIRNRNVLGRPLHVGEIVHEFGIGSHSQNTIAFDLPPQAESVSLQVGLDRFVRRGGCAQCTVHLDQLDSSPIWSSDFITSESKPQSTGTLDIRSAKQLLLTTGFAHRDRPSGSDPLDIRDFVDWVELWVILPPSALAEPLGLGEWVPELNGWQLSKVTSQHVEIAPTLLTSNNGSQWKFALRPTGPEINEIELTRRVKITPSNARLRIVTACVDGSTVVSVQVDGEPLANSGQRDLRINKNQTASKDWNLDRFTGRTVTVSVVASMQTNRQPRTGIVWTTIQQLPLDEDQPN